jgi:hypothetical protein
MNKINIPLIAIVIMISVIGIVLIQSHKGPYQQKKDTLPKEQPIELSGYKTYTLNQCEYIVVGFGQNRWGSHKGDCKNTDHLTETNRTLRDSIQKLYDYNKQLIKNNEYMSTRLAQIDYHTN